MPILPLRIQHSLYEIQNFCKEQDGDCDNCRLVDYCNFIQQGHYFADIEMPKTDIVLGCDNKNICSEFIVMKSNLKEQLDKLRVEKELAVAQRVACEKVLNELCPNWKQLLAEKNKKVNNDG